MPAPVFPVTPPAVPSPAEVSAALARVLGSRAFATSARHRAFLEAIVRQHLTGPDAAPLKELTLGVEVFERDAATFDPRVDNIVRVEARRLRDRLKQYYGTEGVDDTIVIDVPRGGYRATVGPRPEPAGGALASPIEPSGAGAVVLPRAPGPVAGRSAPEAPPFRGPWSFYAVLFAVALAGLAGLAVATTARPTSAALDRNRTPAATLAVLPLTNLTGDASMDAFVDGLTDELTDGLSRVPGLRVTARSSAFVFRQTAQDVRAVGRSLGVSHLVEGSVQKDGTRMKVTTRLVRSDDGSQIWSRSWIVPADDIFRVQASVTRMVADAIDPELLVARPLGSRVRPRNTRAFDAYVRGLAAFRTMTPAGFREAERGAEECIRLEPSFARAHTLWGIARYAALSSAGGAPDLRQVQAARDALTRALAYDSDDALAHANLGGIALEFDYDWPTARDHYQRAMSLSPQAIEPYAGGLLLAGHGAEAEQQYRRAKDQDPMSLGVRMKLILTLSVLSRPQEALALLDDLELMAPGNPAWLMMRGGLLLQSGDGPAAMIAIEKARAAMPGLPQLVLVEAVALDAVGRRDEAFQKIASVEPVVGPRFPYALGQAYAALGEADRAARWLLDAIARHDPGAARIVTDRGLDPIRQSPEFRAVWDAVPNLTTDAVFPGGDAPPQ